MPLVAVDVGNSRVKLGLFDESSPAVRCRDRTVLWTSVPGPKSSTDPRLAAGSKESTARTGGSAACSAKWRAGWSPGCKSQSVERITMIASSDLPLDRFPSRADRVGIDRLLDAVAVNRLRAPAKGRSSSTWARRSRSTWSTARACLSAARSCLASPPAPAHMHEFTDLLPLVEMWKLDEPPAPLGTDTIPAMQAGLYWGAVGGVRELIERLGRSIWLAAAIFLSGGAAPSVARLLAENAQYVPHLTLAGIALTAER